MRNTVCKQNAYYTNSSTYVCNRLHKVIKLVPSLLTALTIHKHNLKLVQLLFLIILKEDVIEHFFSNFFIVLNAFILLDFSTKFFVILIHNFQDILVCSRIVHHATVVNIVSNNLRVVVPQDTSDSFHISNNKHNNAVTD